MGEKRKYGRLWMEWAEGGGVNCFYENSKGKNASWFSNPSDSVDHAGMEYFKDRGFWNIRSEAELNHFKQQYKEQLAKLKAKPEVKPERHIWEGKFEIDITGQYFVDGKHMSEVMNDIDGKTVRITVEVLENSGGGVEEESRQHEK